MTNLLLQYIESNRTDAVKFKVAKLKEEAGDDIFAKSLILEPIAKMLSCIDSEPLHDYYLKSICKELDCKPQVITNLIKKDADKKKQHEQFQDLKENQKALPPWINKEYFYAYGFDMRNDEQRKENTGIYFIGSNSSATQLTNFTIKPLIHVFSSDESNRRLTEISNGFVKEVIELPSRAWGSTDMFESTLLDKGSFFTNDGFTKSHLNRLKSVLVPKYPRCYELNNLGWQSEGFFAFANLIYVNGKINRFDEYGVAEIDGTKYLSMGASNALAGLRGQDDQYKIDKYLKYMYTDVTFSEWTKMMVGAYDLNKAMMGACFAIMAAFRDIIFKRNNNCALPYLWGAAGSGKSQFGESVARLSTHDMPALNLNQTTEFALWQALGRFFNVPALFNEFDEKSIREEFTRAFKGAYDGEGRQVGTGRKGKTKTQPINVLAVLLGQYLSTGDDGALLERTLPVKFVVNKERSPEQVKNFQDLKALEKKGITSISCELLNHREYMADNFESRFYHNLTKMKKALAADGFHAKDRILENFVNGLSITSLIMDKMELAFSPDDFFDYCKEQIKGLSEIISESNALADFWKIVESLVDDQKIEQGYHFKVETKPEIQISSKERNKTDKKVFEEPKKLLYLRFSTIHLLYSKEYKFLTGKTGLNAATVETYMKEQKSYLGTNPASLFRNAKGQSTNTSSYIFDYDLLKVNLERGREEEDERKEVELTAVLQYDAIVKEILGVQMLTFTLFQDQSYLSGHIQVEKHIYTQCISKTVDTGSKIKKGEKVKVKGLLEEKIIHDKINRRLEVTSLEIVNDAKTQGSHGEMQF